MRFVVFFQAEDGIRDIGVTGVQTCALPISCGSGSSRASATHPTCSVSPTSPRARRRSEERRVGKECRSGWSPDHYKQRGPGKICTSGGYITTPTDDAAVLYQDGS